MAKMEIELTEEQLEKVEILKSQDISVGDAIDILFEVKDEISRQIENSDENLIEKINHTGFDLDYKTENLKKNFEEHETYDVTVNLAKHGVKWAKFIKF